MDTFESSMNGCHQNTTCNEVQIVYKALRAAHQRAIVTAWDAKDVERRTVLATGGATPLRVFSRGMPALVFGRTEVGVEQGQCPS